MNQDLLLDVQQLSVDFLDAERQSHVALSDVSFQVGKGEILGIVGESGSGKTTAMLSLLRLLPPNGRIRSGRAHFLGQDLLTRSEKEMQHVRGREIGMIFQGAMNALNPVHTIERQIGETIRQHRLAVGKTAVAAHVADLLKLVGINPERRSSYPHQFSGGMRQRVMIAMALAGNPKLLIADEPTTALDVIVQAQILSLLQELRLQFGLSILLVTHDLGVVAELCDSVLVLVNGTAVEYAQVDDLFNQPQHAYTQQLLQAFTHIDSPSNFGAN